jgi:hypothetical protein
VVKRNPDRSAGRAGPTKSEVTLGGRCIQVCRPRVRSRDDQEMELLSGRSEKINTEWYNPCLRGSIVDKERVI